MTSGSPATDFSVALLGEFIARGLRDIVLSPGSRSQALALAAAEYEAAGLVRLSVRIDERVAGFTALGLAIETRMPALVVTTSGTAVANLHPAVLEAHHSGVPMILLTADRPVELRGIGANQTTDQPGMFGSAVRFVKDVDAPGGTATDAEYAADLARETLSAALGLTGPAGPVQLNLAFREPLSAATAIPAARPPSRPAATEAGIPPQLQETAAQADAAASLIAAGEAPAHRRSPQVTPLPESEFTVVIAGHGAGPRAVQLAAALGAPLIAEVSSGARFGPDLVVAYRELLDDPDFGGRVRRAIVFGHPTLSREVPALLQRPDVESIVVHSAGSAELGPSFEPYNPGRRATIVEAVDYEGQPAHRSWSGRWVAASRAILESAAASTRASEAAQREPDTGVSLAREQLAVFRAPVTRSMLADAVWRSTWPHDRLVLGASRLIREFDRSVTGKKVTVHANRGLAGIDGTVATAWGIAVANEDAGALGCTRVVVGDITLLHDVGALLLAPSEPRPRLQVIVGGDGGGTIFDGLEVAASASGAPFDRVLYTPRSADLRALAQAYGWQYRAVTNRGELDEALAPPDGPMIVEVRLARV